MRSSFDIAVPGICDECPRLGDCAHGGTLAAYSRCFTAAGRFEAEYGLKVWVITEGED